MYADGDCGPQGESTLNQTISTLEAMKLAQHRAYAGMNASKVSSCGVAASISHEKYLQQKASQRANDCSPSGDSVNNSWLYITKSEAAFRRKKSLSRIDPFAPSSDGPDWFKINEKSSVKMSDLTKAPGFDGTLTLLSRINGWITVTPKEKNRSKRLGRYGPFDRSKKEMDLKNVSDLAPHWMHTDAAKPTNAPQFRKLPGITALRSVLSTQGHKQTYLIDTQKPPRSQFAIGDFRHNVMTKAEADRYMAVAAPVPKNMFEWKEDVVKQRFDKPVTGKVGQSLQL